MKVVEDGFVALLFGFLSTVLVGVRLTRHMPHDGSWFVPYLQACLTASERPIDVIEVDEEPVI